MYLILLIKIYKINIFFIIFYFILQEIIRLLVLINFYNYLFLIIKFGISPFYFWTLYIYPFIKNTIIMIILLWIKFIFINIIITFFIINIIIIIGLILIFINYYKIKSKFYLIILSSLESFNILIINIKYNYCNFYYFFFLYILRFFIIKNFNNIRNFNLIWIIIIRIPLTINFIIKIIILKFIINDFKNYIIILIIFSIISNFNWLKLNFLYNKIKLNKLNLNIILLINIFLII